MEPTNVFVFYKEYHHSTARGHSLITSHAAKAYTGQMRLEVKASIRHCTVNDNLLRCITVIEIKPIITIISSIIPTYKYIEFHWK